MTNLQNLFKPIIFSLLIILSAASSSSDDDVSELTFK